MPATRPWVWSVRRELWEHRSVVVAPLVIAGVALFGALISMIRLSRALCAPAASSAAIVMPYSMTASVVLLTGFIVGVFYCVDALNGERRDRSILFWKSLPVSDRTTVLAKASIPFVVQPLLSFAIALATQLILLVLGTLIVAGSGVNPAALWARLPLFEMSWVMAYGLTAHALWFAPIYSWLLLVSAWSRRATFLWAALPFFAIAVVEKVAAGTTHFVSMLKYRLQGAMIEGFVPHAGAAPITHHWQLTPLRFLSAPGLWLGLAFAAACLAAATRLRRNRQPV